MPPPNAFQWQSPPLSVNQHHLPPSPDVEPMLAEAACKLESLLPVHAIEWANHALSVTTCKEAFLIRALAHEQLRDHETAIAGFDAVLDCQTFAPNIDRMALDGRTRCERAWRERQMSDLVDQLLTQAKPTASAFAGSSAELDGALTPPSPVSTPSAVVKARRKKIVLRAKTADKQDIASPKPMVFPIRDDTTDCQYFLKTGKCNYGSKCKFNHPPRNKQLLVSLNRRDCFDYIQSGTCPYGKGCKYNHPLRDVPLRDPKHRIPNSKVSVSSVSSMSDSEEE